MDTFTDKKRKKDTTLTLFRTGYVLFILLSMYFLFINKDLSMAVSNFGIALVFDPFDQKVTWAKRPVWQRVWLLVHLGFLLTGFVWLVSGS